MTERMGVKERERERERATEALAISFEFGLPLYDCPPLFYPPLALFQTLITLLFMFTIL